MNSPCNNSDTLSSVEVDSDTIDNLSRLTISSNEPPCPSKNSEAQVVEQVLLSQSDVNCNKIYANNCSLMNETRIGPDVQREHAMTIPEAFIPTNDGGPSCVNSISVVPLDMWVALRDSIHDKVKIDCVIRQNDHTNAQQISPRMLRSNSSDCVITLYDSESEYSDFSLDSEDDSTEQDSELESLGNVRAQQLLSSADESLHSDGESVESSEYLSDSDEDSNSGEDASTDSDKDSSDLDDVPCDSDEQSSDDEPEVSNQDSATTSDDDKPDSTGDEDSGDDDGSLVFNDEESSDHDDKPGSTDGEDSGEDDGSLVFNDEESSDHEEEESSDDDKSVDLGESSDSSNESSSDSE